MQIYEAGQCIQVHPTFLYEALVTLTIFIILIIMLKKRKFKGELTLIYLTIYSFARMFIEGLRTDSLMLGQIRISQILSLIIFITCICIYIVKYKTKKCDVKD